MDRPSSNRSPSPLSARPNPNSRNSESNSNIRRSLSGKSFGGRPSGLTNPRFHNSITPANSPADHLRRHSFGKEGARANLQVHDEKENEKAARFRSPAKGSKHFMSPTVSAASKFTPSSRKKVLTERNEIVRTSIQFSDFQEPDLMKDSSVNPEKMLDQVTSESSFDSKVDQKEVIVEVPSVPLVTLDSEMTENSDCVSCTKKSISFSDSSPIIAPLDADPSQPPYDPKTNFLSPRPQFLHYKPNPRIEVFLNKENGDEFGECGGMRLEDSFIMYEESQSEDSQKESDDLSSSETISEEEGEPIISEDLSSSETISEEEGEPIISEPNPISTPISTPTPEPIFEAKRSPKPRFFKRAMSISLFLVFLIACVSLSVTDSPIFDSSMLKDVNMSKLYDSSEVTAFAKSNLDELARNFRQWSANSISYLSGLAPDFSQSNELGAVQFVNLTYVPPQENLLVDRYIGVNFRDYEFEEIQKEEGWEMVSEEKDENEVENVASVEDQSVKEAQVAEILAEAEPIDVKPEADFSESESEQEVSDVSREMVAVDLASLASSAGIDQTVELELSSEVEIAPLEPLQPTVEDIKVELELSSDIEIAPLEPIDVKPEADFSESESEQEVSDVSREMVAVDLASLASGAGIDQTVELELSSEVEIAPLEPLQPTVEDIKVELELSSDIEIAPLEPLQSTIDNKFELSSKIAPSEPKPETIPSTLNATADKFSPQNMLGVSLVVFLLAAATVFMYVRQRKSGFSSVVAQELLTEPVVSKQENWEAEVDVVAEESCPSEMSSFQKSSSYTKRVYRESNEAQSHEKRPRTNYKRESLASSSSEFSMGSLSYGSFTTYERIPVKKATGEEEIVTPVRRSSRIRSHVTSSS